MISHLLKATKLPQETDCPAENEGKKAKLTIQVSKMSETHLPAFFHLQTTQTQMSFSELTGNI